MKTIIFALALCSPVLTIPVMGQETQEKATATSSANDITLKALSLVKSIFTSTATATDAQKAIAAASTINDTTAEIVKLHPVLKASPMPSVAEKKAFAQKMLQYEAQVSVIMKKMTNTFQTNPEEVNKILQPAFSSFEAKTASTMTLINTYYPKNEMKRYMDQLKGK